MKAIHSASILMSLLIASCSQPLSDTVVETNANRQNIPGTGGTGGGSSFLHNPDAAFDHQATAYGAQQLSGRSIINPSPLYIANPIPATQGDYITQIPISALHNQMTQQPEQLGIHSPAPSQPQHQIAPSPSPVVESYQNMPDENVGNMSYQIKITNATPSRIFVEAQDANETIYPCGFMQKGQSFSTPIKNGKPIAGPILVVLRDPDQPGAPELRRYRIPSPMQSYNNRIINIKLIPGGSYQAAIDDQVYHQKNPGL